MLLDIPDIPDIPDGWKYVVSSLVGGGIAIFVTFLNNRYQLRKDGQQWEREKLWDGYQKCISNLNLLESLWTNLDSRMELSYILLKEERGQIFGLYSEIYPYLYWIIYNHPNSGSKEMEFLKEIIEGIFHEDTEDIIVLQEDEETLLGMKMGMTNRKIRIPVKINNILINPKTLIKLKKGLIQLMASDSRLLIK